MVVSTKNISTKEVTTTNISTKDVTTKNKYFACCSIYLKIRNNYIY